MVQRLACRLILDSLLVYSCISPRGGRDFSVDIKGIFGFKYRTLTIHPNNNRGTETQQSTSDFDVNGNLLTLRWCFVVLFGWLKDLVRAGSLFGFVLDC
jgi:hypothetical protein